MEIVGIGVDIEDVGTFRAKKYSENKGFYNKIFSPAEINFCLVKTDSYVSFAGKFCAKEAVIKAFKKNNVFEASIVEIINNEQGEPEAFIGVERLPCSLSISHTQELAVSFCVAYG